MLIRAIVSLQTDDGRRAFTGEIVDVPEDEAQRHAQRAAATFEIPPPRSPVSCSQRRDELWMAGIP